MAGAASETSSQQVVPATASQGVQLVQLQLPLELLLKLKPLPLPMPPPPPPSFQQQRQQQVSVALNSDSDSKRRRSLTRGQEFGPARQTSPFATTPTSFATDTPTIPTTTLLPVTKTARSEGSNQTTSTLATARDGAHKIAPSMNSNRHSLPGDLQALTWQEAKRVLMMNSIVPPLVQAAQRRLERRHLLLAGGAHSNHNAVASDSNSQHAGGLNYHLFVAPTLQFDAPGLPAVDNGLGGPEPPAASSPAVRFLDAFVTATPTLPPMPAATSRSALPQSQTVTREAKLVRDQLFLATTTTTPGYGDVSLIDLRKGAAQTKETRVASWPPPLSQEAANNRDEAAAATTRKTTQKVSAIRIYEFTRLSESSFLLCYAILAQSRCPHNWSRLTRATVLLM